MTDEERRRLDTLWRPTLVEVDGATYVCGAGNPPPIGSAFVWLTSDEPDGQPLPREATERRRTELREELDALGWAHTEAPTASPDGTHSELGVAVRGVAREDVIALARAFDQLAVFVVDADGAMDIAWCV